MRPGLLIAGATLLMFGSAASADQGNASDALAQCVTMKTTGADRILTAQWLFANMAASPHLVGLSSVTNEQKIEVDKAFSRLFLRLATEDCVDEIKPLADADLKDAFGRLGETLGEVAMTELTANKEVEKALGTFADYLTEDQFQRLVGTPKAEGK